MHQTKSATFTTSLLLALAAIMLSFCQSCATNQSTNPDGALPSQINLGQFTASAVTTILVLQHENLPVGEIDLFMDLAAKQNLVEALADFEGSDTDVVVVNMLYSFINNYEYPSKTAFIDNLRKGLEDYRAIVNRPGRK